jgi:hypothetical protein
MARTVAEEEQVDSSNIESIFVACLTGKEIVEASLNGAQVIRCCPGHDGSWFAVAW